MVLLSLHESFQLIVLQEQSCYYPHITNKEYDI